MELGDLSKDSNIPDYAKDLISSYIDSHEAYEKQIEAANQRKTYFLRSASHDINNCLSAILGSVQGAMGHDLLIDVQEDLRITLEAGRHIGDLTRNLLDIDKIEKGGLVLYMEKFYLEGGFRFVKYHHKNAAESKGLSLSYDPLSEDINKMIMTNPFRVKQILCNLVGNSVKFTDEGSVVFGANKKDESTLEFYVHDTGMGIPSDFKDKIFDPYFQVGNHKGRAYGGSGIGLSIIKDIVDIMGGSIRVASELDKGASFFFTIPYHPVK